MSTSKPPANPTTAAFHVQAVIAFGLAITAMIIALWQMPGEPWVRAFLVLDTLFLVSSTFTLAKVVRDRQEANAVVSRVDQARVERMLAEHDPFKAV